MGVSPYVLTHSRLIPRGPVSEVSLDPVKLVVGVTHASQPDGWPTHPEWRNSEPLSELCTPGMHGYPLSGGTASLSVLLCFCVSVLSFGFHLVTLTLQLTNCWIYE